MYIIISYIIGFIFCIIANLLNNHFGKEEGFIPTLIGLWLLSPVTVPLTIIVGLLCGIGLLMKYLTKKLEKLIDKICM